MTPTPTDVLPMLYDDEPDEPRVKTVGYFRGGAPEFALCQARPAMSEARRLEQDLAEMAARCERLLVLLQEANRDHERAAELTHEALDREAAALARAEDAETRLEISQRLVLEHQRKIRERTLESAMDHAARTIVGKSRCDQVKGIGPGPAQIASRIRRQRAEDARCQAEPSTLVALADLVVSLLEAERSVDEAERALAKAVRR